MTTLSELHACFANQQRAFAAWPYPALADRQKALAQLRATCSTVAAKLPQALREDFGSHDPSIGLLWELGGVLARLAHTSEHLEAWMQPSPRDGGGHGDCYVQYQPKGVIGNMVPWNFPIDISLGPLVDILAAGNSAIIKPSEYAPSSAELVRTAIAQHFEPTQVAVVTGGVELAEAFAELPWNHLLYTGNPATGRKVMAAAAKHLTPVTLELGGKCPTLILSDRVNDDTCAEILSVKAVKSGQVCINTDYVLAPAEHLESIVLRMRALWAQMFPTFVANPSATGIINDRHFARLTAYLTEARQRSVRVEALGDESPDPARRILPLTLVIDPPEDLQLMHDEIFGPILPIKPYRSLDEAIAYVNAHPRPLALYVFTEDRALATSVLARTQSGGACVNAIAVHASLPSLPFGGVGQSGIGAHHAHEGFLTFSHARSVYHRGPANPWELMRPPWGESLAEVAKFVIGEN